MPSEKEPLSNNTIQSPVASTLSQDETRQILTPFAFNIDKSLFGLSLASPSRRAIALLIDLLIITLLSDMPGELLAVVIAVSLYRLGGKQRAKALGETKGYKRRVVMRFTGAIILFVVLLEALPILFEQSSSNTNSGDPTSVGVEFDGDDLSLEEGLLIAAITAEISLTISKSECKTNLCWQEVLTPMVIKLTHFPKDSVNNTITSIVQRTQLNAKEQNYLETYLIEQYQQVTALKGANDIVKQVPINEVEKTSDVEYLDKLDVLKEEDFVKDKKPVYSIVEWIKGFINDLGLGFGWAAFYFTVFTALWHGQTLGKKLLGIQVLQLDGTPLSLWDSFGRYGGYGAGIATGMLGFLQIFWDPNRQAIHDKISTTVVINTRKSKRS